MWLIVVSAVKIAGRRNACAPGAFAAVIAILFADAAEGVHFEVLFTDTAPPPVSAFGDAHFTTAVASTSFDNRCLWYEQWLDHL